jgi:signal transduction histidine kinase
MLLTVSNASKRMQKLIEQFQNPEVPIEHSVALDTLLQSTVADFTDQTPAPVLTCSVPANVDADASRLSAIIGHILQNAIDATPATGKVDVSLTRSDSWAEVVIADTGCGMSQQFIEERLFAPFDSTKGVTGMGVGVYQTRDYLHSLGGDVEVHSTPDQGSEFVLRIPISGESQ